jgi:zinc protease
VLRRISVGVAAAVVMSCAAASVLNLASVTDKTLANGLTVIVKHEPHFGLVAAGLHVRCGSVHDPEGKAGVAHFTEHLLFEAQRGQSLGLAIENLGGYINAETLRDFTSVSLLVASSQFEAALGTLAQRISAMTFDPAVVAEEKQIILQEMADRNEDPVNVAQDTLWQTAFQRHPYRWPIGGTAETVERITAQDLEAQYRRFYVASNMALIVVGDVEPTNVMAMAERFFGSLPRGETAWQDPPEESPPDRVRTEVSHSTGGATVVAMGFPAPGMSDPRAVCATDLIYTLLSEGEESWLAKYLVREKQLAFGATCDFLTQRYPGLLIITAVCPPKQELAVRQAIAAKLEELRTSKVSQNDLDRAKRLLYTAFAFSNETFADQVSTIGFYAMIDAYKFAFDYIDVCQSITAEELQSVAQRYLDPDKHSVVILRPKAQQEPEARLPWPLG